MTSELCLQVLDGLLTQELEMSLGPIVEWESQTTNKSIPFSSLQPSRDRISNVKRSILDIAPLAQMLVLLTFLKVSVALKQLSLLEVPALDTLKNTQMTLTYSSCIN